jgi:hypothetical protein
MPNSVQTLPAIEAGLLGSLDHLFSPQATLPRRAAKARPLRVTGWFGLPLLLSDFFVDFKSFFHSFRVLDEAAATCFFAEDSEEKMRDIRPSIKYWTPW